MKKITLFGSPLWPGCHPVREVLLNHNIPFQYIDITDSMKNLKIFLSFRDKDPYFESIKKKGSVGIPVIMIGNGDAFYEATPEIDLSLISKSYWLLG